MMGINVHIAKLVRDFLNLLQNIYTNGKPMPTRVMRRTDDQG